MERKNILFIKTATPVWMDLAENWLDSYNWNPVMWVGNNSQQRMELTNRFPDAFLYDHIDAMQAYAPKNFEFEKKETLSESLLDELSINEGVFYEMIDRWSVNIDKTSYEDFRQYFLLMIRVWLQIIKGLHVDIIICPTVPHRLYDYVAYLVAKHVGCEYLMHTCTAQVCLRNGNLASFGYIINNLENRTEHFRQILKIEADNVLTLSSGIEKYLELTQGNYNRIMPTYLAEKQLRIKKDKSFKLKAYKLLPSWLLFVITISFKILVGDILKPTGKLVFPSVLKKDDDYPEIATLLKVLNQRRITVQRTTKAISWYESHCFKPNYSIPYVYVAPHFQPERSTCPDAGLYQTIELIVETLAGALPKGWIVYYKEHPSNFRHPIQFGSNRSVQMYKRMHALCPQLRFMPVSTDPFDLIDNARVVVTATGTSGWEAVTRGIPAIIFGDAWYRHCQGVYFVKSIFDCKKAFSDIKDGEKPAMTNIRHFLSVIDTIGVETTDWYRDPKLEQLKLDDSEEYYRRIKLFCNIFWDAYNR